MKTVSVLTGHKIGIETRLFTEQRLDWIEAGLDHCPRKSVRRLAQKTGISKLPARTNTEFLKLKQFKTTAVHELQPCDPTCNWILLHVHEGEINPRLISISEKPWFHLHKLHYLPTCIPTSLPTYLPN